MSHSERGLIAFPASARPAEACRWDGPAHARELRPLGRAGGLGGREARELQRAAAAAWMMMFSSCRGWPRSTVSVAVMACDPGSLECHR